MNDQERARAMPTEIKLKVIEAYNEIKGKSHPDRASLTYLFEIFDKHIQPYPLSEMERCNDCRVFISNFWKYVIEKW